MGGRTLHVQWVMRSRTGTFIDRRCAGSGTSRDFCLFNRRRFLFHSLGERYHSTLIIVLSLFLDVILDIPGVLSYLFYPCPIFVHLQAHHLTRPTRMLP